jgi:hypothetical protein
LVPIDRNLHEYECGGINVGGFIPPTTPIPDAAAATREYIWERYRSRRRAYVSLRTYSKEGDRTDITFYVQPDHDAGRWSVSWNGKRHMANRRKEAMLPAETFQATAYSIRRIANAGRKSALPDTAVLDRTFYRLQYDNGVVVLEL